MKLRNIFLIIIAFFIVTTMIGEQLEQTFIARSAQQASNYVKLAADCALANVVMTDEFFTSGATNAGYNTAVSSLEASGGLRTIASSAAGYKIDTNGDGTYEDRNIFAYTYNMSQGGSSSIVSDMKAMYEKIYTTESFTNWAGKVLHVQSNNPSRKIYWVDTLELELNDGSMTPSYGITTFSGDLLIPKLLTMGASLFTEKNSGAADLVSTVGTSVYDWSTWDGIDAYMKAAAKTSRNTVGTTSNNSVNRIMESGRFKPGWKSQYTIKGTTGSSEILGSSEERVRSMLDSLDYSDYQKISTIGVGTTGSTEWYNWTPTTGSKLYYYLTPTSLGLTYIDPNVLNVMFQSNMDLLVRSRYLQQTGTTISVNSSYTPVIDNNYYPVDNTITSDAAWARNVVNDGSFYYLRGEYNASSGTYSYDGTTAVLPEPKIEYIYYNFSAEDIAAAKSIGTTTLKTDNLPESAEYNKNAALTGSGTLLGLSATERAELNNLLALAINPGTTIERLINRYSGLEDYNLIIAKVTFYADIAYPYITSQMRGNALHFGHENTGTGAQYAETDLRALSVTEKMTEQLYPSISLSPTVESILVDGNYMYEYTTYFAVAA